MQFNANKEITDFQNMPISVGGQGNATTPLTLFLVISQALTTDIPAEAQTDTGELKAQRYQLAKRLNSEYWSVDGKGGVERPINLSAEEVVLIKSRVGKIFNTNVVGSVYEILA